MKQKFFTLFLLFLTIPIYLSASTDQNSPNTTFEVYVIEYSKSHDYDVHYIFNNEEILIYEQDKVNENNKNILRHRTLLGKDRRKLDAYLKIFSKMKLKEEYSDKKNKYKGARNQKRINYSYNGDSHSILISNVYNEDINNLIIFLNDFIYSARNAKFQKDDYRMAEFVK